MTGMYTASAALAALHEARITGLGQHLDIPLLCVPCSVGDCVLIVTDCSDVCMAMLANQGSNYLVSGRDPKPATNAHPNIAPYDTIHAKDTQFIVGTTLPLCSPCENIWVAYRYSGGKR